MNRYSSRTLRIKNFLHYGEHTLCYRLKKIQTRASWGRKENLQKTSNSGIRKYHIVMYCYPNPHPWVSWKQRPLRPQRPQNLKTKTPIFWGAPKLRPAGRQCDWKLSAGDKNFEATFSVLDWHSRKFVSFSIAKNCKKLTSRLFEVFNFHRNNLN